MLQCVVAGGALVSLLEDEITYVYSVMQCVYSVLRCVAVYCVAGGELVSLLEDEITIDRVNSDGN